MKKSITRKLQIYMYSFGLFMGVVFPFYASLFDSWESIWFKVGALAAGIMVGFFCYTMVKLILLKEIRKINTFAEALRNHDLTASISIESNDTIGTIVTNLSHSTDNIRNLVGKIHGTSETMLDSLHQLRRFSDNMNSSADDISERTATMTHTSEMISHNSEVISRDVSQTATSIAQITHEVDELTESVQRVNEKCQQEVTITDTAAKQISDTRETILALASRSTEIANIVQIIETIADKTNLLAINAHVEAANAGVHGKSFAIVAREVKTLADQSKHSAEEIERLIEQITPLINRSRISVTESADQIATLSALAHDISSETIGEVTILKRIDGELTVANKAMQNVSQRFEENTQGIGESASKLKSVNNAMATITEEIHVTAGNIQRLEKNSAELAAITRKFRLS